MWLFQNDFGEDISDLSHVQQLPYKTIHYLLGKNVDPNDIFQRKWLKGTQRVPHVKI